MVQTELEQVNTRVEPVTEVLHGETIVDPYRWLEDSEAAEVRAWTAAQNARTEAVLSAVPGRAALERRLTDLLQVGTVSGLGELNGRYFFQRREGDQNQPVLCVKDGLDSEPRVLVDPNREGEAGLVALDWWYPSHDASLLAYGLSVNGDEWSTLHVVDVATGDLLPDRIARTRYASVAWLPDNSGFYYTRYPEPGSVPPGQENYNSHVFFHPLGEDPAADDKVFGEGREPEDMIGVGLGPDGRWLIVSAFKGWTRSDLYVRDLHDADGAFIPIVEGLDAIFQPELAGEARLLVLTNLDAPNYRVIGFDLNRQGGFGVDAAETVVRESATRVIEGLAATNMEIVTLELEAAIPQLRRYNLDGVPAGELDLPGIGSVTHIHGSPASSIVTFGYHSFVQPPSCYVVDLEDGERHDISSVALPKGYDPEAIQIRQVRYPSKDGTQITMFVVHDKRVALDGENPTYLTGYGGFHINRGSEYGPSLPAWLEQGGVFALPNLRGGSEYGEAWHRAGMRERKQNVFDDFHAAAEWLIANGYTKPEKLAIGGGSNGGLLVGAAITQRPELFQAGVCAVPLLDMLRYHQFSIARLWIPEYGSADDANAFAWLRAYSPYHNVHEGTRYPAILITTGEQDSRVDPLHARKMTALLQSVGGKEGERPVLLRAEANAGHGQGKPLHKRVAEAADQWGFIGWQLGVDWAAT